MNFYKQYLGKSATELKRGIRSLENQIAKHRAKISDPGSHVKGWSKLDPRQQRALVEKKWPGDIARQQEQLDILRGILGGQ